MPQLNRGGKLRKALMRDVFQWRVLITDNLRLGCRLGCGLDVADVDGGWGWGGLVPANLW